MSITLNELPELPKGGFRGLWAHIWKLIAEVQELKKIVAGLKKKG